MGWRYGSSAINKWIFAKKQPAAARNGYLIVRICLLDVWPTCWRYCDPTVVRPVKGANPNASRYDTRAAEGYRVLDVAPPP
jgi:hypothetical protein